VARHQRTRVKHIDVLLDPEEVRALLSRLCIELGFCLPPIGIERMAVSPPRDIDEFTREVLVTEGYGVATSDPLFNQVRGLVAQAFVDHQER
jgi:hypothetical protein